MGSLGWLPSLEQHNDTHTNTYVTLAVCCACACVHMDPRQREARGGGARVREARGERVRALFLLLRILCSFLSFDTREGSGKDGEGRVRKGGRVTYVRLGVPSGLAAGLKVGDGLGEAGGVGNVARGANAVKIRSIWRVWS